MGADASLVAEQPGLRAQFGRLWHRLRGGELSRGRTAASVSVGLFIGSLPLYGLHLPLCLAVCVPLRLDAVVAYLAANISNPLFAPFLVMSEVEVGSLLLTGHAVPYDLAKARHTGFSGFMLQAGVGSIVVGAVLAALGALIVVLVARRRAARQTELSQAVDRTIRRYRDAHRRHRVYVTLKLRSDPVVQALAALPGSFGSVLDAGAGRGQFGLLLMELGRADAVRGFDLEAEKVGAANIAAGGEASFEQGDLSTARFAESDTVLLLDVLHYLPRPDQDSVLERAAAAVRPGGRLIVREVGRGAGSFFTKFFERIGKRLEMNRGRTLEFRALDETIDRLERLGLSCRFEDASHGTPMSNALIVAERPSAGT
jgi:uncharacterized protein (DUF2062 family)